MALRRGSDGGVCVRRSVWRWGWGREAATAWPTPWTTPRQRTRLTRRSFRVVSNIWGKNGKRQKKKGHQFLFSRRLSQGPEYFYKALCIQYMRVCVYIYICSCFVLVGVRVFIEKKAQLTLLGTEMDYIETKLSSEFVFNNPNIKGTCGCGESFNIWTSQGLLTLIYPPPPHTHTHSIVFPLHVHTHIHKRTYTNYFSPHGYTHTHTILVPSSGGPRIKIKRESEEVW